MRNVLKRVVPRRVVTRRLRDSNGRSILFTFDDGPDPSVTPHVLDLLGKHNARAIFFVIGELADRHPALIQQIRAHGHAIGNHTYSHSLDWFPPRNLSLRAKSRDIAQCQRLLGTHQDSGRLFRPPGGRLAISTIIATALHQLRLITWSLDIKDWSFETTEQARVGAEHLLAEVCGGDIILLHESGPFLLDVLRRVLPELDAQGYDLHTGITLL